MCRSPAGNGYAFLRLDIGVAIYLWDCLNEQAFFPTIDLF